jgi:hypothetical protein
VKLPCGVITSSVSPTLSASDPLDRHAKLARRRRDAQRIVAPHFLAADVRAKCQVLPGSECERLGQVRRHFEADRVRLVGFGHDLRHAEPMKFLHYQRASG